MTNLFHKELNLSIPPIADSAILDKMRLQKYSQTKDASDLHRAYCFGFTNVNDIINPELLDLFKTMNIKPKTMCMFGSQKTAKFRTPVHGDIYHESTEVWKSWPAGINYEISLNDVDWYFYDTNGHEETPVVTYSKKEMIQNYPQTLAAGSRWGNDSVFDQSNVDELGFKLLETYKVKSNTYYLNRVEIPHSVESECLSGNERISVQIKFNIQDIPTWDRALEVFKPFIVD